MRAVCESYAVMNKAKLITELETMVEDRLFGDQPWLANREISAAVGQKLIEMGLIELCCVKPPTWRPTPLGTELNITLFQVFIGTFNEWEIPSILRSYGLIDESEEHVIYTRMEEAEKDARSVLSEYVKRAYFEYRNAGKFLH